MADWQLARLYARSVLRTPRRLRRDLWGIFRALIANPPPLPSPGTRVRITDVGDTAHGRECAGQHGVITAAYHSGVNVALDGEGFSRGFTWDEIDTLMGGEIGFDPDAGEPVP
jgi:hypothetical protein